MYAPVRRTCEANRVTLRTDACSARRSTLLVPVLALLAPAVAGAADPGRWKQVRRSPIPLVYYQGVTADPARNLYFDGVYVGLFRTGPTLVQKAGVDDVIPEAVRQAEGYNHIGDISWDARKGGRVLLPWSATTRAQPGDANTCGTGSIGVADPRHPALALLRQARPGADPQGDVVRGRRPTGGCCGPRRATT